LLRRRVDDPGALARNDATRMLADVARHHPEVAVPLEPVLHALNGPTTADRNKGVAVVAMYASIAVHADIA